MKKRNAFLIAVAALLAFAACIDKDLYDPEHANEVRQAQYSKAFKQAFGEIDPNHDWGFGSSATKAVSSTRALSDYATPSGFAADAKKVTAYTPTYTAAPTVPDDAIDLGTVKELYWPERVEAILHTDKIYYVTNETDLNNYIDKIQGEGNVKIYIPAGVTINGLPSISANASRVEYYVLPGGTLETNGANPKAIYNWGTLNVTNGLAQTETQVLENYNTMTCSGSIQINGTMYSATSVSAVLAHASGKVYVNGDLKAEKTFGFKGELYVSGEMSGHINLNNGLAAHVGSVNTDEMLLLASGSQLVVERDVVAASLGDSVHPINGEIVIKGTSTIEGVVYITNGTKGYFEKITCASYTANASDVWVGCSLKLSEGGKFQMNGNSKFTIASGAYLYASEADVASNTKMTMMSNAMFEVAGKLQLNNANTNEINGSGSELAIVKANTLGANYEKFSNTFTGNIGVDFVAWDYDSSTGLIDQNTDLKRMSDLADVKEIPETECSPGYEGSKVEQEEETVEYIIYYKEQGTGETLHDPTRVTGKKKGEPVTVSAWDINNYTVVGSSQVTLPMTETVNEWTFYYTKNKATLINSWRIFAEDLGSIGDFDFNDVVFDVEQYSDNTTKVILQAAGGTLPLRLQVGVNSVEVHEAFKVGTTDMVNTGMGPTKSSVEVFSLTGAVHPDAVRVSVDPVGELYYLESPEGEAPAKICIPAKIQWSGEKVNIKDTYPKFVQYVGDRTVRWWE